MSNERCEPADTMPDIISRLNAACYGMPYAKILWPHRLLHDAAAEIAAAKEREAGLVEVMTKAADLFQWYADEHIAAGKTEKAARNQGAADDLRAAIKGTTP